MRVFHLLIVVFGLAAGALSVTMLTRPSLSQGRVPTRLVPPLPTAAAAAPDPDRYDADVFEVF
ncbi:hypothetical protein U8607_11430 [Methylobacterium durans]|uniref:hypothetical protein n=1 Tax=Methylobacterium durans TaxID=2202825 RepID=UPI002AFEC993|nr:hypothetical protein [Methylobacterium durans]MEA1832693.1 hypothetical protein [Methylobacterium durans]